MRERPLNRRYGTATTMMTIILMTTIVIVANHSQSLYTKYSIYSTAVQTAAHEPFSMRAPIHPSLNYGVGVFSYANKNGRIMYLIYMKYNQLYLPASRTTRRLFDSSTSDV